METSIGFEKERADCCVRALSLASNLSYEEVYQAFKKCGRKNSQGTPIKIIKKTLKLLPINVKQVKRSGSVNKLIRLFPKGNYFCYKYNHAFAMIDGITHDLISTNSHINGAWLITKLNI